MSTDERSLATWLHDQRWFQGKDRTVRAVAIADSATLLSLARWLLIEVRYAQGPPEWYQLVLVRGTGAQVGQPTVPIDGTTWADASTDPVVLGELARLAADGGTIVTDGGGVIEGTPCATTDVPADGRALGAEQSNTSVVFGETAVLKLFRRLDPGVNPDIELTAALTAAESPDVPAQIGALALRGDPDGTSLGVVSRFVADGRDTWRLAVADAVDAVRRDAAQPPGDRDLIARLRGLGAATARVHAALTGVMPSRPATRDDVDGWASDVHDQIERVVGDRPIEGIDAVALHHVVDVAADRVGDPGVVARIHGDLHLGQVLDSPRGWQLLDFEGEPAASAEQRRAPGPPARDIAGMLRSFDYAAASGAREASAAIVDATPRAHGAAAALPARLAAWRDAARASYLAGYEAAAGSGVDPALLALFELHKSVYEIAYERAYRPDWLAIAVGGVQRILDRVTSDSRGNGQSDERTTDVIHRMARRT